MTVFLLRHGITAENLRGVYLGREDVPLCREGEEALQHMTPPTVELVCTSPLLRCLQTVDMLFTQHLPVRMAELAERDFGRLSGLTHREITALPGFEAWGMEEKEMVFPNGEPLPVFLLRCRAAWEGVLEAMEDMQAHTCAVVTHGGVMMGILDGLLPGKGLFHWRCENAEGFQIDVDSMGNVAARPWRGGDRDGEWADAQPGADCGGVFAGFGAGRSGVAVSSGAVDRQAD